MRYSTSEFEHIYKRSFAPCMRLAMSLLKEEDEALDVVQESFVKLWEWNGEVLSPEAFVMRMVRNACLNRMEALDVRERYRKQMPLSSLECQSLADTPQEEVAAAINVLLTDREKQVISKVYSEGYSYKEAAEQLKVSTSLINKNVVSALKRLRSHFKTQKK